MAVATTQSWQEHTSDGSTAYFPFNFNYDTTRPATIVVGKRTADNTYSVVDANNYELIPNAAGDGGQIRFIQNPSGSQVIDDIPPAGTIIRIERVSVDTSSATWQIGLEMSELVNLFDRLFRLVQENKNNFANVIKTFETQHNISLYELLSEHDNHLLYWDNTTQTLTPTDFPKEDVVRATDGMFLRISTDTAGNPYLEWSLTGTDNWHSVSDTAVEALSKINNHLADKNNPHETSMSKLTDVELTNLSANQFLTFDGIKWKNVNYNITVAWGGIFGDITDQTDLMNKFAEYVRTDGSSTMTGVLKMRASESFKGAIAPSWDGVGFFKLNDNDSVTLMASMEETDGLTPATNNKYNIGKSAYKWKDLYLSGKAYMSVINNGFDIAVPVTNSADTFALKSQVDDAANSGEQLYTTGVWFAKMYSASVVPTGAEYDGKNYADFSQVDNDNNPIVVIYEGQSGSWVEIARITPPANHVAYLTITSKIWDIAEQTDQQGGEVLWSYNQKTFTPYPKIVSLLNQANTDLSNLTGTGANIANWSNNVTNCITEIPQDINLELNNGTLTLKAGSKCYLKTDTTIPSVNIASDLTTTQTTNGTYFAIYNGSALTTVLTTTYDYSGLPNTYSLPLAVITVSGGAISSIDQIFNGFGYIGSTVFVLPGVKGLIPDGRNADGSLKSIAYTNTTVVSQTLNYDYENFILVFGETYSIQVLNPISNIEYRKAENIIWSKAEYRQNKVIFGGRITSTTGGQITSFTPKTAFRAVDYNEADFVVDFQRPTADNGYTWYRKYKSGWVEQGGVVTLNGTISATNKRIDFPITMADTEYYANGVSDANVAANVYVGWQHTTYMTIGTSSGSSTGKTRWEVKGMAAS